MSTKSNANFLYNCPECKFDKIPFKANRCPECKVLMDWSDEE